MHTINELTIENSALCLIDHQPWVAFPVTSITPEHLTNNVLALAKVAKAFGVPTVLSTINGEGGPLRDPLFAGITEVFPDHTPIDRTNTNAWSDAAFVEAVRATGGKKLVMAGPWTEVCLAQTTLSAIRDGFEDYFVADASGGLSPEAHQMACQRMIQAGATPLTWFATLAEWCPDNADPLYQATYPIALQHGGGVQWGVEYIMANLQQQGGKAMTGHKLSRDNAAFVLVDFLTGFLPGVKTISHDILQKNAEAFARVSEIFGLPTILLGDEGGFRGTFFPGVLAHAGHAVRIERSAVSAWDVPEFREELERIGRRKIVLGGISLDICTAQLALDLLAAGFEVYVVVDVSGSDSPLNEQGAMMRLAQAGAVMVNWGAVASEIMRDWSSEEGPAVGALYQELSAWGNRV